MPFDSSLIEFLGLCEKVSRYYIEARYPPGPPVEYEYDELKDDLAKTWELIEEVRGKVENDQTGA